ncbi:recombination protein RecR [bacterium]|nr:recombination protein RecR [bacterium]
MRYPRAFEELIDALKKLPGIGLKSAERIAYKILEMDEEEIKAFAASLINAKKELHRCSICGQITDQNVCDFCADERRNQEIVCVVQNPKDAFAIEKARDYNGLYHILYGVISATNGVSPRDLNIQSLIERISKGKIKEVIIATNPTTEGETTALYLAKILSDKNVLVSRIAYGLPLGANLDYTDEYTLIKAIEGRRKM